MPTEDSHSEDSDYDNRDRRGDGADHKAPPPQQQKKPAPAPQKQKKQPAKKPPPKRKPAKAPKKGPPAAAAAPGPAADPDSEDLDSIDDLFAEYSETIRDEMRTLDKGPWEETDASMDAMEDPDVFLYHGLPFPPAAYDALQAAGDSALTALDAVKTATLTPEAQERVAYRTELVHGVQLEDQKWLKLRAYHRAAERLRAERAVATAGPARRAALLAVGAPLDVVPAELIDMSALQLAQRRVELDALVDPRQPAPKPRSRMLGLDASGRYYPAAAGRTLSDFESYSEESDWGEAAGATSSSTPGAAAASAAAPHHRYGLAHDPRAQAMVLGCLAAVLGDGERDGDNDAASAGEPPLSRREQRRRAAEEEEESECMTLYTPAYMHFVGLQRQQKRQERQRTLAFWGTLATAGVLSLWRILRRMGKKKGVRAAAPGPGGKAAGRKGSESRAKA